MKDVAEKVLSISIAAYNIQATIDKAICSVLKCHNVNKIQIIVVNDGSKDCTSQYAHSYEKKYPGIVKVVDKENGGYGSTINAALKVASGKYFKLLDGDDTYISENIDGFIDFLSLIDSDIVITPYKFVNIATGKDTLVDIHSINSLVNDINALPASEFLTVPMHEIAVRTSMFVDNNVSITENCFYTDTEYNFYSLLYAKTITKYQEPIYSYTIGDTGQSVGLEGRQRHYLDGEKVARKLIAEFSDLSIHSTGVYYGLKEITISSAIFQYINYILVNNKVSSAFNEAKLFDAYIKNNGNGLYQEISKESKMVYIMRLLKFHIPKMISSILYRRAVRTLITNNV